MKPATSRHGARQRGTAITLAKTTYLRRVLVSPRPVRPPTNSFRSFEALRRWVKGGSRLPPVCRLAPFLMMLLVACGGGAGSPTPDVPDAESSSEGSDEPGCKDLTECERACNDGDPAGCESAGRMYETGEGANQDYQQAATLYDKACDGGREEACAHLAMMYDIGLAVEEDPDKANALYKKACASGNRWACKRGEQLERE